MTKTNLTDQTVTEQEINEYIEDHLEDPENYLHKIAWELREPEEMSYTIDHSDLVNSGWEGLREAGRLAVEREGTEQEIRDFANYAWQRVEGAMRRSLHEQSGPVSRPERINQLRSKIKDIEHQSAHRPTVNELVEELDPQLWFNVTREKVLDALDGERTWDHQDSEKRINQDREYQETERIAGETRKSLEGEDGYKPLWLDGRRDPLDL